jgi:glycerate 2-kinase
MIVRTMRQIQINTHLPENLSVRADLEKLLNAAIVAADPYQTLQNVVHIQDRKVIFRGINQSWNLSAGMILIAIGKASVEMTRSILDIANAYIQKGVCVTKSANSDISFPSEIKIIRGGHPVPDQNSILAAQEIKSLVEASDPATPVLFLISGGGSSLVAAPANGISLDDYQEINRMMLSVSMKIDQINIIRKHIDEFKGGGALRWMGNRPGCTLILSDVVSGRLDMVASGPTLPDRSTYADAIRILDEHQIYLKIPQSIRDYLSAGKEGHQNETIKPDDPAFSRMHHALVGSIGQSVDKLTEKATELGYKTIKMSPWFEEKVEDLADRIMEDIHAHLQSSKPTLMVYGGEATVQLKGTGMGGRNSHLALLLARRISDLDGVILLTFATDGEDGNSPAGGAILDSKTYTRAIREGMDIEYYLGNSDSYRFFNHLKDAIITGSTGTNVNDLVLVIIDKEKL